MLRSGLDQRVTFTDPGEPVPRLIAILSKSAHLPLFAPAAFQSDVISVRVKDATLKELLDRIASLTCADWQENKGGFDLVRSQQKLVAEERAEHAIEVEMLRKDIAAEKKKIQGIEAWNEQTAQSVAVSLRGYAKLHEESGNAFNSQIWKDVLATDAKAPGGRLMSRIMSALDPEELASLPLEHKTVFSNQPTRLQKEMPHRVMAALSRVVAEQNIWADVAGRILADVEGNMTTSIGMRGSFSGRIGKVLLTVFRTTDRGVPALDIEIRVCDQTGALVVQADHMVDGLDAGTMAAKTGTTEKSLTTNRLMDVIAQVTRPRSRQDYICDVPADISEICQNPEKFDPVALVPGELLVQVAEARDKNLVADVSDETFQPAIYAVAKRATPSGFLQACGHGLDIQEDAVWMTISSRMPHTARADRIDRKVLGTFLRSVADYGFSLDNTATYAVSDKNDLEQSLGFLLGRLLNNMRDREYNDPQMLRIYGHLTQSQRRELLSAKGLPLSQLEDAQTEQVNLMLFGWTSNLSIKPGWRNGGQRLSILASNEPTELFINGIPPNSVLKLKSDSAPLLITSVYRDADGFLCGARHLSFNGVAQRLIAKERPGIFPWLDAEKDISQLRVRPGTATSMTFTFDFGDIATLVKHLSRADFESGDPVSIDQLPGSIKDAIAANVARVRRETANSKPGQQYTTPPSGTTKTPPPRI